jgi:hypothetical protein
MNAVAGARGWLSCYPFRSVVAGGLGQDAGRSQAGEHCRRRHATKLNGVLRSTTWQQLLDYESTARSVALQSRCGFVRGIEVPLHISQYVHG